MKCVHYIFTHQLNAEVMDEIYTFAKENEINELITACEWYIVLNHSTFGAKADEIEHRYTTLRRKDDLAPVVCIHFLT